jgi:hypothetical protein
MKFRHRWPWLIVLVTAVFSALVFTDALPLLRGPLGWRWSLNQSGLPWWPTLLAGGLFLLVWWGLGRWLDGVQRPFAVPLALTTLFLITLGLQAAQLTRFHPNPAAILYERLASDQASGYFSAAQEIAHLPTFLREFPERMPTFRADPHPRSKPPGIVLLYWGWEQILAGVPSLAATIGHWARSVICNNLWLATRSNTALSANVVMGFLTPIISALAIFPAYGLANRFWGRRQGWLAAGLVAILPGRLIFAPHMDTVYPLFALLALFLVDTGLRRKRPFLSFLGGLCIGIATFMSLINGLVAVVIGLYVIGVYLPTRNFQRVIQHGLAIFAGTFLLWAVYWAIFGVTMWEIYAAAAPARHDLERSYTVWLVGNLYDFGIFAGLGLFLLALPNRGDRSTEKTAVLALLAAFWGTLLLFNLSGSIRGEVGRIWLMFAPFPALLAARIVNGGHKRGLGTAVLASAVLASVAMGGRWQTTEVEWPIVPLSYESAQIPADATFIQAKLGENITLAGFELVQADQLDVMLFWETAVRPDIPYTVFLHLLDESGAIVAQQDTMPQNGALPTTCWQPNSTIPDAHTLDLASLPPGSYTLQAGLYDQQTAMRLGEAVQLTVIGKQ